LQPYGYTGRRYDSETGLWYFRARYFDAELGRFISRDPLEYVDGMSMYQGYFASWGVDPFGLRGSRVGSGHVKLGVGGGKDMKQIRERLRQLGIPTHMIDHLINRRKGSVYVYADPGDDSEPGGKYDNWNEIGIREDAWQDFWNRDMKKAKYGAGTIMNEIFHAYFANYVSVLMYNERCKCHWMKGYVHKAIKKGYYKWKKQEEGLSETINELATWYGEGADDWLPVRTSYGHGYDGEVPAGMRDLALWIMNYGCEDPCKGDRACDRNEKLKQWVKQHTGQYTE
jgi:RHS repeat-associated protein